MPNYRKQAKKSGLRSAISLSSAKGKLILFLLVFAVMGGGYMLYSSYASPTDGLRILAERQNTGEKPFDGDRLVEPETLSFRLYEDGLVVCGGYTDAAHPDRYYSTTLTQQQITDFQSSVQQTGFFSLEKSIGGKDGLVLTDNYQELSFVNGSEGYVVTANPNSTKPPAYNATNALIDTLCASLTTPYQPEEVQVTTKVISGTVTSEESLTSETDVKASTQPTDQKVSGKKAKALNKSLGKKGQKVYKKGTQTVEIRADEVLPEGQSIQDGKTSDNVVSAGLRGLLSSKTAQAVDVPEAYTFCAKDSPCKDRNPEVHLREAKSFYNRTISQTFDFYTGSNNGYFYGRRSLDYYKACHPWVSITFETGCGTTPLVNVLLNIIYETQYENNWLPNKPRVFILGHDVVSTIPGGGYLCGVAAQGPTGKQTAVTTYAPTSGALRCSGSGYAYSNTTHEFSHLLGLPHIPKQNSLMYPSACSGKPLSECSLDSSQGAWLIYNSKWLYPLPKK